MHSPIPVATGWSPSAYLLALLNVLGAGALAKWIGTRPKMRELGISAKQRERNVLASRIDTLEARLDATERRHDTHIEILTQLHSAEIGVMRHRLANESLANVGLLSAIQAGNPEKLDRVVERIEADRARREANLAQEQAELVALRASALTKIAELREPLAQGAKSASTAMA